MAALPRDDRCPIMLVRRAGPRYAGFEEARRPPGGTRAGAAGSASRRSHGVSEGLLPTTGRCRSRRHRPCRDPLQCHRGRLGPGRGAHPTRDGRDPPRPGRPTADAPDPAAERVGERGVARGPTPPSGPGPPRPPAGDAGPAAHRPTQTSPRSTATTGRNGSRKPTAVARPTRHLQPAPPGGQPGEEAGRRRSPGSAPGARSSTVSVDSATRSLRAASRRCSESRSASRRASSDSTRPTSPIDVAWASSARTRSTLACWVATRLSRSTTCSVASSACGRTGRARAGRGEVVDQPVQPGRRAPGRPATRRWRRPAPRRRPRPPPRRPCARRGWRRWGRRPRG